MVENTGESLDFKLQALLCGQSIATDFGQKGKLIAWLAARNSPAEVCSRMESLRNNSHSDPANFIRIGGFYAHLHMRTYRSGLVAAAVHDENHNIVPNYEEILECRGMTGSTPNLDYPTSLKGLVESDFGIKLSTILINTPSGRQRAYLTKGEKTLRVPGSRANSLAEATLAYEMLRTVLQAKDSVQEYIPILVEAAITVKEGDRTVKVTFNSIPHINYCVA